MWPTLLALLCASGSRLETDLPALPLTTTRYGLVDVSGMLRAAPTPVSTPDCIERLLRAPLAKCRATMGVAAFDTTPLLTLDLPVPLATRNLEARLARSMVPAARLFSDADLVALGDDAGAFDGSAMLQWQWQSARLLPMLERALTGRTAERWPRGGIVLDRVVLRHPAGDQYYQDVCAAELARTNEASLDDLIVALQADYTPVTLRMLALQIARNKEYRRLHLRATTSGTSVPVDQDQPGAALAPAEAMCKILRNIASLLANSPTQAQAQHRTQVVVVSDRPDALLFLWSFLDSPELPAPLPLEWLWLMLPGGLFIDVAAAATQLTQYGIRVGLDRETLLLLAALAGGSESLGQALWRTLPLADPDHPRPVLPSAPHYARPIPVPVPTGIFDSEVTRRYWTDDSFQEAGLVWLRAAYLKLVNTTDLVSWYTRVSATAALRQALPMPERWLRVLTYAHYRIMGYIKNAWQKDAFEFWENSFATARLAGLTHSEESDAGDMARTLRSLGEKRTVLLRAAKTKHLMLRSLK